MVLPRSQATGLEAPRQRMTPAERRVRGKAARAEVPRESHAEWKPSANRTDPVGLLESQGAARLPDLVPVRYGRMMETPFTYYRGAALPMASDLATTPATGMIVQACGDAHLSNFGLFGSPERKLVFDVNDFDETLPAPWEWDVKRLAASLEVAARENGFSDKDRRKIALAAPARYRQEMRQLAGLTNLDVWYTQVDIQDFRARWDSLLKERQRKTVDKGLAKARTRDSMQELQKLTRIEDGQPRIISEPPVIIPIRDLLGELADGLDIATELRGLVSKYRRTLQPDRRVLLEQYEVADLARKVVGVGSVGTRCWIALMLGRDDSDPLFLQIKEAEESVLARFAGASRFSNQGERVVNGQRLMQAASDIFLGWQRFTGLDGIARDFYVRQLRDWKFSVERRVDGPAWPAAVRRAVRADPGPGARTVRGRDRPGRLPRQLRRVRQRDRGLRRGVRGPERARLPGLQRGHRLGPPARRTRRVARSALGRGPGSRRRTWPPSFPRPLPAGQFPQQERREMTAVVAGRGPPLRRPPLRGAAPVAGRPVAFLMTASVAQPEIAPGGAQLSGSFPATVLPAVKLVPVTVAFPSSHRAPPAPVAVLPEKRQSVISPGPTAHTPRRPALRCPR